MSSGNASQPYHLLGTTPFSAKGKPTILMCPPDYFNVSYAINPWMNPDVPCDVELAKAQWKNLYNAIREAGADVELLEPKPDLPDLVFTANSAFVYNNTAVIARYKNEQRQPEEPVVEEWFSAQGFKTVRTAENAFFEGSGDSLIWETHVFAGYKARSSIEAHDTLRAVSGLTVHSIELCDMRYYHVDVCLCPLDNGDFIYAPVAFTEAGQEVIESVVPTEKLIVVSPEEAELFACNAVSINNTVIFNQGATAMDQTLQARGLKTIQIDLSEFLKSGGSAKCLTLRLG
jgi:N-dimethylarginine dimethylaminohydrolase